MSRTKNSSYMRNVFILNYLIFYFYLLIIIIFMPNKIQMIKMSFTGKTCVLYSRCIKYYYVVFLVSNCLKKTFIPKISNLKIKISMYQCFFHKLIKIYHILNQKSMLFNDVLIKIFKYIIILTVHFNYHNMINQF